MFKNVHLWLPSYRASRKRGEFVSPTHVFFCFVDHFEPQWAKPSFEVARSRIQHWLDHYPRFATEFLDANGRPPQHSFFFPAEEYRPEYLDDLAKLCRQGYGEVEIHLHHDNDTAENLAATIQDFKLKLRNHGFLSSVSSLQSPVSSLRYAFIHGNWALDNSRADGRWCGVNNELQVLRETGCYADFTLPSAPSDTQTRKINSIYYATDDPKRPKSHDTGVDVRVCSRPALSGRSPDAATERRGYSALPDQGDLMLVQGPLALNWRQRKWGVLPRIEHADVAGGTRANPTRIDLWVRQRIGVVGKPDWIFVKVHTHGCQERNFDVTHGKAAAEMHTYLQQRYNDGQRFVLHYVTAREVFNLVKAAEAGKTGDPNQYRDFVLPPPPVRGGFD